MSDSFMAALYAKNILKFRVSKLDLNFHSLVSLIP